MLRTASPVKKLFYLFSGICSVVMISCKTTRPVEGYFTTLKTDTSINRFITPQLESKIIVGDVLGIVFKSLNPDENGLYNYGNVITPAGTATPMYTVQPDGTIKVMRLGNVKAEGLTRKQLALQLEKAMEPYLKAPLVEVSYLNHKVTILGSVARPQVLNMSEETVTLLEALVMSGDLTEEARRNDIMVIRDSNDQKMIKHVNLQDHSIFNSPWYYLKSNDIVYVMADRTKDEAEERRRRLQTTLSLVASGTSLLIILLDRITR